MTGHLSGMNTFAMNNPILNANIPFSPHSDIMYYDFFMNTDGLFTASWGVVHYDLFRRVALWFGCESIGNGRSKWYASILSRNRGTSTNLKHYVRMFNRSITPGRGPRRPRSAPRGGSRGGSWGRPRPNGRRLPIKKDMFELISQDNC